MVVCELCGRGDMLVRVSKDYVTYFRRRIFKRTVSGFRCLNCKQSFISSEQDIKLEEMYQDFVAKVIRETKKQTCSLCEKADSCPYSWNGYNINGKCMAEE